MAPEGVRQKVMERREAIVSGDFDPFAGPVSDQSGEVRIAEGQAATDEALLGMDWFVQGVIGTTE
jgi:basic membrane protein A